jgi:tagaturonate reductase
MAYTLFERTYKGEEIQGKETLISNLVSGINPYINFNDYVALAKEEELAFIISG